VFPIVLWQPDALAPFLAQAPGPVNVLRIPPAPSETELAKLGVARISYGALLHQEMIEQLTRRIAPLLPG
jgi:2-methylisocitrate lyase-like PEP mutase family enzyme